MENRRYTCPVCYYPALDEAPYTWCKMENGNYIWAPSYEYCPCCGFQFGYHDYPDIKEGQDRWRQQWILNGGISHVSPKWNLNKHLIAALCRVLSMIIKK